MARVFLGIGPQVQAHVDYLINGPGLRFEWGLLLGFYSFMLVLEAQPTLGRSGPFGYDDGFFV